jgi:hypothetical protein
VMRSSARAYVYDGGVVRPFRHCPILRTRGAVSGGVHHPLKNSLPAGSIWVPLLPDEDRAGRVARAVASEVSAPPGDLYNPIRTVMAMTWE